VAAPPVTLQCEGLPAELWLLVRPRLAAAMAALDLTADFAAVRLSGDDLPSDGDAWYVVQLLGGESGGQMLTISCHPAAYCRRPAQGAASQPPRAIWDQSAIPASDSPAPAVEFSAERTDAFLHHHLLTVGDLWRGDVRGADIPPHLAEAFAAAWSVGVDGRLARRQLPGYRVADCRQRFSRLFAAGGILLPEHWQIFEALWDGGLAGQAAVTGAVRLLPRL
jgi:hypothetical protein